MNDFPVFTTEYGVGSLFLKEIPYKKEAYIQIRDSAEAEAFLRECVDFCRMCGAERIYAAGHAILEKYPLYSVIFEMRGTGSCVSADHLWPVTPENVGQWRGIYNEKMAGVDNAATLSSLDEKLILSDGGAYFVHDGETLLGIGWLSELELMAIAAAKPRMGGRVLSAMLSLAEGQQVRLEVASTNLKAIRLYERHGFIKTREIRSWYCVYGT